MSNANRCFHKQLLLLHLLLGYVSFPRFLYSLYSFLFNFLRFLVGHAVTCNDLVVHHFCHLIVFVTIALYFSLWLLKLLLFFFPACYLNIYRLGSALLNLQLGVERCYWVARCLKKFFQ